MCINHARWITITQHDLDTLKMQPPIRTQHDGQQDAYSLASAIDASDLPDLARQEFKQEADINYILSRFGIGADQHRPPVFGDQDFDLDLHSGYMAIAEAQRAWHQLPDNLKQKYRTTRAMLDAMNSGELALDLTTPEPAPPIPGDPPKNPPT